MEEWRREGASNAEKKSPRQRAEPQPMYWQDAPGPHAALDTPRASPPYLSYLLNAKAPESHAHAQKGLVEIIL